jgi:hypothetical protein
MWRGRATRRSARAKSGLFSGFVIFQGFARWKIFLRLAAAAPFPRISDRSRGRRRALPSVGSGREYPGSAARPCTRYCGFEASEPIPFSGADSIFSSRCGAISGRPVCRQATRAAIPASEARSIRPALGTGSRKIEILSAFCEFSTFCNAENFPVATPPSCSSARGTRGRGRTRRRLRSSRVLTLSRLSARAQAHAIVRGSSPRSVRCRRFSRAVSATPELKSGRSKDPSTSLVFQKVF